MIFFPPVGELMHVFPGIFFLPLLLPFYKSGSTRVVQFRVEAGTPRCMKKGFFSRSKAI